jgi:hypothetical protein
MPTAQTMQWHNHTRSKPCPICAKPDRCQYTDDGAHRCFRTTESPRGWKRVKICKDGTPVFRIDDGRGPRRKVPRPRSQIKRSSASAAGSTRRNRACQRSYGFCTKRSCICCAGCARMLIAMSGQIEFDRTTLRFASHRIASLRVEGTARR